MLTEKTQTMSNNYCASLESSPQAGRSQAKPCPKWALLPWGLYAAFNSQVSLLKWIKQKSAWWAGEPSSWLGALEVPEQSMTAV